MLVSYLAREFAKQAVPGAREHRDEAVKRLRIENETREKQNSTLNEDTRLVEGLIRVAMSCVFPELVGYCLFKALGPNVHLCGPSLIGNGTFKRLAKAADFKQIKEEISNNNWVHDHTDLLQTFWYLFNECLQKLVASSWRQQWMLAPNRTRFNYRPSTREQLFKELDQIDDYIKEVELTRKWAVGMNKAKGLFAFVQKTVSL